MSFPFYVNPEQMAQEKAEFARKGIARGKSIVTIEYSDGVMMVAGFFYVYWNYLLKPANEKILKFDAEVTDILSQVETMKRTANKLPALQRQYNALLLEVGKTEKRLPKKKNLEEKIPGNDCADPDRPSGNQRPQL